MSKLLGGLKSCALSALLIVPTVYAGVSQQEAAQIGKQLTDVGAERAGNADGSIPAWAGGAVFRPEIRKETHADLESLRVKLVADIRVLVSDPKTVHDFLTKGQQIMDADPASTDKLVDIVHGMLSSDAGLKAEFDQSLAKHNLSVDSITEQIKSKKHRLDEYVDPIVEVVRMEAAKGPEMISRLVKMFDIGQVLQLLNLVKSPKSQALANDMMMQYMPPYVKGFLDYRVPGKSDAMLDNLKPLYVVTTSNLAQYSAHLSDGQKAMFATYPDYKMIVFPSVRNAFFPDAINKATAVNATKATLIGTDNVQGASLGFPFPIPKSGAEVMWNHKLRFRGSAAKRYNNQAIVKPDGTFKISKLVENVKFGYANLVEPKSDVMAYYLQEVISPPRLAGQITLVHEIAAGGGTRSAWLFSPGLGRIVRAPDVGFDNPMLGSDGQQFDDQVDVFNGALERYNWKLIGKREMLIPYNTWVINSPTFKYVDLIRPGHLNQDLLRYELHRVWVVEADLKEGMRHQFSKRVFYLDEDSWAIAAVDCYDNHGKLWKVQEAELITVPFIPTVSGVPETIYDLLGKSYFVTSMTNEDPITDFEVSYPDSFFEPSALRQKAKF